MKIIKAKHEIYGEKNNNATGERHCHPNYVDAGMNLIVLHVAKHGFKIIFKHCLD